MSRIGKLPVRIPEKVEVKVENGLVSVKGPKGNLELQTRPEVTVTVQDGEVIVTRKDDAKLSKSYHGLYRQLIQNMVTGVSTGFQKVLMINGVGYRAEVKDKILTLNLGYSMPIEYIIPEGISIVGDGPSKLTISGISKEKVGKCAAEIRSLRGPEPYKGKGIKYDDETIRRKVGKSGGKK
ncbi:MAG: 50S ribosomal protein L6 [Spirochaetes bacterium]|uniref:Large ribosomal subunit protein uL6 n=1 Tax=Candidatus Ornithospirochaeta stercoripullorum TaxID=2840899 RepID=A0A9D9DZL9_9SPIO|nr:50S ribosomal protein L6 [Candidatus Ornithospirochaeta stercoripullorum]